MHINQTSFELAQEIISQFQSQIKAVLVIKHSISINWRQTHLTEREKIKHLNEGLKSHKPLKEKWYFVDDFLKLDKLPKANIKRNQVWSLSSKVILKGKELNQYAHLPMMNFHPEGSINDATIVEQAVKAIRPKEKGAILDSGRYWHYYGQNLLNHTQWLKFMADFLMPCVLISPRYVALGLIRGYATLRLTADNQFKPKIPTVIKTI